jgi:hypothetical protein
VTLIVVALSFGARVLTGGLLDLAMAMREVTAVPELASIKDVPTVAFGNSSGDLRLAEQ